MNSDPTAMKFVADPGDTPLPDWMAAEAPAWFREALAHPSEQHWLEVLGCRIGVREWGVRGLPGLLFVHGFAAHSHWWDFIAPAFAPDWHVAAIDLSGMGDSGHRLAYSFDLHVAELAAACDALGLGPGTTLVGHSYGGFLACLAAARDRGRYAGVIMVDSPVRAGDETPPPRREAFGHTERNLYGSYAYALSRFRVVPEQPCEHAYVLAHIAPHSLRELAGGYTWKFDDRVFELPLVGDLGRELVDLRDRLSVIYAARSKVVQPKHIEFLRATAGAATPIVAIADADHHLFLNQPLAFLAALQGLLGERRRRL